MFAMGGTGVIGAALAGWASDNKFSLLGGLRAASQMVSYEVAMGLSLVGLFMIYGVVRPSMMVEWQGENTWGIFVQPFAFFLFLAALVAETKRIPFDQPEGESEIVAGYFVEYSGMKFGMFFMGEYIELFVSSALLVTLFFGGYALPFLHNDGLTIAFGDTKLFEYKMLHTRRGAHRRAHVLRQDDADGVAPDLLPLDAPPLPLRPGDEAGLDQAPAALARQHHGHRHPRPRRRTRRGPASPPSSGWRRT